MKISAVNNINSTTTTNNSSIQLEKTGSQANTNIQIDSQDADSELSSSAQQHFDGTYNSAELISNFGSMAEFDKVLDKAYAAMETVFTMYDGGGDDGYVSYKNLLALEEKNNSTNTNNTISVNSIIPDELDINYSENEIEDILNYTTPANVREKFASKNNNNTSKYSLEYYELVYKHERLAKKLENTTDEDERKKIKSAMNCVLEQIVELR